MDNVDSKQLHQKIMQWQVVTTLLVALVLLLLKGQHTGLSALAGGLSVLLGTWVAAKIAQRNEVQQPTAILFNLLKAEAAKIVVIVLSLFVIFKSYEQLVPFALIMGLAAAALFSGAAMAKQNKSI